MMRIALVHDWLTGMRGGEAVLEAIAELFPTAHLFTLVYVPASVSPTLSTLPRTTSWLQKIPGVEHRYRQFLPLMPHAIEHMDFSGYDLIISSSHCVAKGIQKPKNAVHISYVHAPMRYMWDRFDDYFGSGRASFLVRWAARTLRPRLQAWDRKVSQSPNVDHLIANSRFIADQIRIAYGREASVVYPFVNLQRFRNLPQRNPGKNYVMVGAFAPNKRVDLAITAFNQLGLPLLIIGSGQEKTKLQKMAGPTIEFLGALSNPAVADILAKAKAFIFPGKEDFGITPLEAMASGVPVIAFGEGGACETVTQKTGVLFRPQSVDTLVQTVRAFEAGQYPILPEDCVARAREFTRERFQEELLAVIQKTWVDAGRSLDTLTSGCRIQ